MRTKSPGIYCKDAKRRGEFEVTPFTFPLSWVHLVASLSEEQLTGQLFTSFGPAMSKDALQAKGAVGPRSWWIHRGTAEDLVDLAQVINPEGARLGELLRSLAAD